MRYSHEPIASANKRKAHARHVQARHTVGRIRRAEQQSALGAQHVPANGVSRMPEILQRAGPFSASHASDGERIVQRHIYVAPPDHHLLVERGHLHVVRGPKENGFRPAIDAMFRTAARAYGPRVVGVVLTSEAPMSDSLNIEAAILGMSRAALDKADALSTPAPYSCLDCGGVLGEFYDGELLRFRCQVGHVYSRESLVASQNAALDTTLWAAYRALNERATLERRLVRDAQRLNDVGSERRFVQLIEQAERQKEQLRQALLVDETSAEASDA